MEESLFSGYYGSGVRSTVFTVWDIIPDLPLCGRSRYGPKTLSPNALTLAVRAPAEEYTQTLARGPPVGHPAPWELDSRV